MRGAEVFRENLLALIGPLSVNAWAKAHGMDQTTIQRLINGQDPRLSTVLRIAAAVGVQPWQLLLAPDRPERRISQGRRRTDA